MLRLQMLAAGCGDCLWLEYGTPPATNIVIIDGGLRETAAALRQRIGSACRERGITKLDVELLVVTHIDNDHILGIIELLKTAPECLNVKDVWFNGRPQLMRLPTPAQSAGRGHENQHRKSQTRRPADLLGTAGDSVAEAEAAAEEVTKAEDEMVEAEVNAAAAEAAGGMFGGRLTPADLLGPLQGDELSGLLDTLGLPCNQHSLWKGDAVRVPDTGTLPVVVLEGGLTLTLIGPTLPRLYGLCKAWSDVLGGTDEPSGKTTAGPSDLLGRRDSWPPVWKDTEQRDSSRANGSSIVLLAEYEGHAVLLAGDGYAPDIAEGVDRLRRERNAPLEPFSLAAFKLPHHGSEKNLSRDVLEKVDCSRYLISTDGSGHGHPDPLALLRILRHSCRPPQLLFNYEADTTRRWEDSKSAIVRGALQDYETRFPANPADGLILEIS